jgi:hypothetical protein
LRPNDLFKAARRTPQPAGVFFQEAADGAKKLMLSEQAFGAGSQESPHFLGT